MCADGEVQYFSYKQGLSPSQNLLLNQELELLIPLITLCCLNYHLYQTHCQQHLLAPTLLPQKTLTLMIFHGDLKS